MTLWSSQVLAGILRASTLALRFGLFFFLARALPIEDVGLYGLYWAGLQLAASSLTLDVYAHSTRLLLSPNADKAKIVELHLGFLFLVIICGTPIAAILFFLSSSKIVTIIALIFFFQLSFEIVSTDIGRLLVPLGKPLTSNVINFVRFALWIVPLVILIELTYLEVTLFTVLVFWLIGSIIGAIMAFLSLRLTLNRNMSSKLDLSWIFSALLASWLLFLGTLVFRSILGLDKFIVEMILGLKAVGLYAFFASISLGVLGLIESGVSAWRYPELLRHIQSKDYARFRVSLSEFLRQNSLASIGLMTIVVLLFPLFTRFYLDYAYTESIAVFYIVAVGVTLYCISMPFHYVIYGSKKDYHLLWIYSVALLVMIVFGWGYMEEFGVLGAGMMLAFSLISIAILRVVIAYRLIRTEFQ